MGRGGAGSPDGDVSRSNGGARARWGSARGQAAATRASDRRERERARHEGEVLEAAARVFARRSLARATMAEIAREAQFAVGTLYKFFPSKEALFERVLLDQVASLEAALALAVAGAQGAVPRLEAIAATEARFGAERRGFLSLFGSPAPGVRDSPAAELPRVLEVLERIDALVLRVVRAGVTARELTRAIAPELVALAFRAATRAFLLERVAKRSGALDDAAVRDFVRAVMAGLSAEKRRSARS